MAEIAGAIVGGIGICGQLFQLASQIQKAIKTIKNSRQDIRKLAKETIIFAGLYQMFSSVCKESDASVRDSVAIAELNSWAQTSADGLEELLQKVEALIPGDKSSRSIEETLIAYVQWFFSKSTVKALRASLSVARESINGFSTLMHVNKLNTKIILLEQALRDEELRRELEKQHDAPLEEIILMLKQQRKHLRMAHQENNNTLREAMAKVVIYQNNRKTADNVPALKQLLRFTAALDEYAEKTLPPRRSSHRSSSSSSVPTIYIRRGAVPPVAQRAPVTPGPSQKSVNAAQRADTTIERPGMEPRQYMNDPNGTILSPPIVKTSADKHPTKTAQVGRHTITLSAKVFHVNANKLKVTSYASAYAFFQELLCREDILDDLDKQLSSGCQESVFYHIPRWQIEIGGIRIHGHSLL